MLWLPDTDNAQERQMIFDCINSQCVYICLFCQCSIGEGDGVASTSRLSCSMRCKERVVTLGEIAYMPMVPETSTTIGDGCNATAYEYNSFVIILSNGAHQLSRAIVRYVAHEFVVYGQLISLQAGLARNCH